MKKLIAITIFMMILNGAITSQCLNDTQRKIVYTEVTNQSKKYSATSTTVSIISNENTILFKDDTGQYRKEFSIFDCDLDDSTLTYNCFDVGSRSRCDLIFGTSGKYYTLIVKSEGLVWYKFKSKKK